MGVVKDFLKRERDKASFFKINLKRFIESMLGRKRTPFATPKREKLLSEKVVRPAFRNKQLHQIFSREIIPTLPEPTGEKYVGYKGREYTVWSDGSHRRSGVTIRGDRRLVAV